MKVASWNVNSLNVRMPHLSTWLATAAPDIVALQETKLEDEKFPRLEIEFEGPKLCNLGFAARRG
jgi:exodeoxyribonuclease-3